jgi:radical SAM superfamily enzyme YgiQ (UPF0313 family)
MIISPVYPQFPETFWSYKHAVRMLNKKATMPPLGLATALSLFPSQFSINRIVDENVESLEDEHIQNSDLVAISAMDAQRESTKEIIKRSHDLGKKVILGGPYATFHPDETNADYVIGGEAELTLPAFLEDLINGKPKRVYDENSVRNNGRINLTINGKPQLWQTPLPRWDLLNLKNYFSMAVQYARGCPWKCEFCNIPAYNGNTTRTKTPDQMIKEFESLRDHGWRGPLFIVDDNFIGNLPQVRKLLPEIVNWQIKNGYPYNLFTEASMDLALKKNKDVLRGMNRAGFDQVFLGYESDDPAILKAIKKTQNLGNQTVARKVEKFQRYGLEVTLGSIVGFDGDTPDVFDRQFKAMQEMGIPIAMVGLLTAVKGSALYDRLKLEGRLRGESQGVNTHTLGLNFDPKMDEKVLIDGYADLIGKLYDSQNFYDRCRVLKSRRGNYHKQTRANFDGIAAALRVTWENIKRFDKPFFKYGWETLASDPAHIPEIFRKCS